MKSLTAFVIFCISMIILFTVTAIVFQWKTGQSLPDALIMGCYGFFGTELCASACLKIFKIKKE